MPVDTCPLFSSESVWEAEVVFTGWLPKASDAGEKTRCGGSSPVPLSATCAVGGLLPLPASVSVPGLLPFLVGVNVTVTLHTALGARLAPQLLLCTE